MPDEMDVQERGTSDKRLKGRGHRDASDYEDRYQNTKFTQLEQGAKPGPLASVEGWVVFVSGVHEESQEEDIHEAFSEYGEVKNIYLNLDRQTGFVKGYALVEFKERAEAEKAIKSMNGKELLTQAVHVDWAFKMPQRRR
jgi:RNA-binding protein 8A